MYFQKGDTAHSDSGLINPEWNSSVMWRAMDIFTYSGNNSTKGVRWKTQLKLCWQFTIVIGCYTMSRDFKRSIENGSTTPIVWEGHFNG